MAPKLSSNIVPAGSGHQVDLSAAGSPAATHDNRADLARSANSAGQTTKHSTKFDARVDDALNDVRNYTIGNIRGEDFSKQYAPARPGEHGVDGLRRLQQGKTVVPDPQGTSIYHTIQSCKGLGLNEEATAHVYARSLGGDLYTKAARDLEKDTDKGRQLVPDTKGMKAEEAARYTRIYNIIAGRDQEFRDKYNDPAAVPNTGAGLPDGSRFVEKLAPRIDNKIASEFSRVPVATPADVTKLDQRLTEAGLSEHQKRIALAAAITGKDSTETALEIGRKGGKYGSVEELKAEIAEREAKFAAKRGGSESKLEELKGALHAHELINQGNRDAALNWRFSVPVAAPVIAPPVQGATPTPPPAETRAPAGSIAPAGTTPITPAGTTPITPAGTLPAGTTPLGAVVAPPVTSNATPATTAMTAAQEAQARAALREAYVRLDSERQAAGAHIDNTMAEGRKEIDRLARIRIKDDRFGADPREQVDHEFKALRKAGVPEELQRYAHAAFSAGPDNAVTAQKIIDAHYANNIPLPKRMPANLAELDPRIQAAAGISPGRSFTGEERLAYGILTDNGREVSHAKDILRESGVRLVRGNARQGLERAAEEYVADVSKGWQKVRAEAHRRADSDPAYLDPKTFHKAVEGADRNTQKLGAEMGAANLEGSSAHMVGHAQRYVNGKPVERAQERGMVMQEGASVDGLNAAADAIEGTHRRTFWQRLTGRNKNQPVGN